MMLDRAKLLAVAREWQSWLAIGAFAAILYLSRRLEIAVIAGAMTYSLLLRDWNLFSDDNGGLPEPRYADDSEEELEEPTYKGALDRFLADPIADFDWREERYGSDADAHPEPVAPPDVVNHGVPLPKRKPIDLPRRR